MGFVGGGAVGAYVEVEGAGFAFCKGVFSEEAKVPVGYVEGCFLGFTWLQVDLTEVFQLFDGTDNRGGSVMDVELDHFRSGKGAFVFDGYGCLDGFGFGHCGLVQLYGGDGKGGVAQAVSEGV